MKLNHVDRPSDISVNPSDSVEVSEDPVNLTFLHSNPKVHKMVSNFTKGELKHKVDMCKSCYEIRPQFHSTEVSENFKEEGKLHPQVQNWKITNSKCDRCCDEYRKMKPHGKV